MWFAVLGYLLLFGDRQARAIVAQIRLRYENEQLVGQLQQQYALAEQARTRAESASRSKSLFFAAANHDLRQPLHSLGLFANALRNGNVDESGRKMIDQILQCTESLEQLFDNLLDISKLDAYSEGDPRVLDLNGAFNVGNRGMVEFIEVFKNETEYLHAMITATQEKVIPAPGRHGMVYVDVCIEDSGPKCEDGLDNDVRDRFDESLDRFFVSVPNGAASKRSPALDVAESEQAYTVTLDLPGVAKDTGRRREQDEVRQVSGQLVEVPRAGDLG